MSKSPLLQQLIETIVAALHEVGEKTRRAYCPHGRRALGKWRAEPKGRTRGAAIPHPIAFTVAFNTLHYANFSTGLQYKNVLLL